MAIEELDEALCNGCKICLFACPEDVFSFDEEERKARITYQEDCVACFVCEAFCPTGCIVVSRGRARPLALPY